MLEVSLEDLGKSPTSPEILVNFTGPAIPTGCSFKIANKYRKEILMRSQKQIESNQNAYEILNYS